MLIGLNGVRKSGKDTSYALIADILPVPVERRGFADNLKLSVARLFYPHIELDEALNFCDWFKEQGGIHLLDESEAARHPTLKLPEVVADFNGRIFLQRYGTEAHRDVFGQDFWIRAVLPENLDHFDNVIVITDVRFPNEAEAVREAGGFVWRINRPEVERGDQHASEQRLPDELIDKEIDNSKDFDHLRKQLADALVPSRFIV